jgi:hypothetical protein
MTKLFAGRLKITVVLLSAALLMILTSCATTSGSKKESLAALKQEMREADTIVVEYFLGEFSGGSPEEPKVYGNVEEDSRVIPEVIASRFVEAWPNKKVVLVERGSPTSENAVIFHVDLNAVISYPNGYFKVVATVSTREMIWFSEESTGQAVYIRVDEKYWDTALEELQVLVEPKTKSLIRRIQKS